MAYQFCDQLEFDMWISEILIKAPWCPAFYNIHRPVIQLTVGAGLLCPKGRGCMSPPVIMSGNLSVRTQNPSTLPGANIELARAGTHYMDN